MRTSPGVLGLLLALATAAMAQPGKKVDARDRRTRIGYYCADSFGPAEGR